MWFVRFQGFSDLRGEMPRDPKGEKRPADVIASAHKVFQIAVGEDADEIPSGRRRSGMAGAAARTKALSSADRKEIARKAAAASWHKPLGKG